MNNKDKNSRFINCLMAFVVGCFVGVVIMFWNVPDDIPFLVTLGSLCLLYTSPSPRDP